ncbi:MULTISPECIES: cobyric acid synthase [unclassified Desulfovibrio]|uniref:cobyric acid synthase n=1 Tax=unclassified Desulfovibrio TaxID=2593640 RepID=UPI001F15389E|nr:MULTISPECIES: cobyric acid synthase [unclassified Desulfovibrio]
MPEARPRVPALMVQGTCSDAGKSLIAAALCRLFARRGLKVAPFKAQNMALNSFVTLKGEELGRAQALQAAACGLEPDARMNPVLLKPVSDQGSQVIVLGRPVGMMRVRDYIIYKRKAWGAVRRAWAELSEGRDLMVLEGAGSPAEINLRRHDIVNMRMAAHAGAKVLLVADIDRGGAFAALAGTMALLGRADRARVAGFALNRFRGDASLLAPAMEAVSRRTRRPFFGVIPMIPGLRLPEEDSVSFKLGRSPGMGTGQEPAAPGLLDAALIDLPHISNVTDCDALRAEPGLRLRAVRRPEELGRPQLAILPGSRNSMADMAFLRASGLADALRAHALKCLEAGRGAVVGICGGLQLLGERIHDPLGLEAGKNGERTVAGLGLLPLVTELAPGKTLRRAEGTALPTVAGEALPVAGYEIHHGVSESRGAQVIMRNREGAPLGWGRLDGGNTARIWGTYLHGVFDSDSFRHALLGRLRREAGLAPVAGAVWDLGPELDRVADVVAASLDMAAIDALLGL